tara:strand:+ start:240 stop:626 length:387 start_codon:yes stop_codon:yes gene_type:complete
MNTRHVPGNIAPPIAAYSHGVEIPPGARILHTAGEIGIAPDGTTPDGVEAQTEVVWNNLTAILESANMGIDDVVKVVTYITREEDFLPMATTRAKFLGDSRPASTAVVVKALAKPEWLVEVELIAAKA